MTGSNSYLLSGELVTKLTARRGVDEYFYIQVTKNIDDEKTIKNDYLPFYEIKEFYPRYLFVADLIFQKNIDGIKNINIIDFIVNKEDL